ncbi:NAD(P)-dependent alcohol dehydrogenase [Alkaliflexus imshenetskii]|uniref:NAD(P)-dependent alcohol dehydrogenase n=1 Tax=Alkaliflexus imshenetskii TaxID=286730 RepID=UPI001C54E2F0|nr:NAD(P)-dependent alcohol dehydrogenase [Alkaliflexus imshenetskii]
MESMKAVVYQKRSKPDRLCYCDVEKPRPKAEQVLVKIYASSINAADYRSFKMGIIPKNGIFGADVVGEVVEVGSDVQGFKLGDAVICELADSGFGAFAQYVAVNEKLLIHKPTDLSYESCAAFPLAAITALQAIRKSGDIIHGHDVLIVGSGGGVGTFAIQLAKYFGASVTAVCSTQNVAQASALGANRVLDYTREDFSNHQQRYDRILAINGNHPLTTYKRLLKRSGACVMVGGSLTQIMKFLILGRFISLGSRKLLNVSAKSNTDDLQFLAELMNEGHIKPVIEKMYPLSLTAEAMQYAGLGHARGKVVIAITGD